MNKVHAVAAGRVLRATVETPDGRKPYACLWIELTPSQWGDKTFAQRIEARHYRNPEDLVESLEPGEFVTVTGDADCEAYSWNGKNKAKIVIHGNVSRFGPFPALNGQSTKGDEA